MIRPLSAISDTSSSETSWLDLAPESFIESTVGKLERKSIVNAIRFLCDLRLLNSDFAKKVDESWGTLIQQANKISLLISPLSEEIDFKNSESCLNFLKNHFSILNKYKNIDLDKLCDTNPEFTEELVVENEKINIIRNHLNIPELWALSGSNQELVRTDLITHESFTLKLEKPVSALSFTCTPPIATSEKWVALCSHDDHISVIEKNSGKFAHTISEIGAIQQMHFDGNHLYALCREDEPAPFKLLQYDSHDWEAPPNELEIPGDDILKFYSTANQWLFVSYSDLGYQLLALPKDNCFSNPKHVFVQSSLQANYPFLNMTDEGFLLTLTPAIDPETDQPLVLLEQLVLTDSEITKKCLQVIPMAISEVEDFHVQLDKIFILNQKNRKYAISCFDLRNGQLLENFEQGKLLYAHKLKATLVVSSPEKIQLIFNTIFRVFYKLATASMTLNFKLKENI